MKGDPGEAGPVGPPGKNGKPVSCQSNVNKTKSCLLHGHEPVSQMLASMIPGRKRFART